MKQVRLVIGAAGLAPLALALAPGSAQARLATSGPTGHGKAHGRQAKSVRVGTPAPSTVSPLNRGSGCVGVNYQEATSTYQKLWFWSALPGNSTVCIGTVEDKEHKYVETGVNFRLRIWSRYDSQHQRLAFSHTYGANLNTNSISVVVPVHLEFGSRAYPHVMVCGAWLPPAPQTMITVCKTVTI